MSDDLSRLDPLPVHLDAAGEQMRHANHHSSTEREVIDLYGALGALQILFRPFDQLAAYLQHTVQQADAVDFRHDRGDDVALALTAVDDGITHARDLAARATRSLHRAWAHIGHLALDIPDLVCPECGEPAHRGTPTDLTPTQRTAGIRPRYRHADRTQLCCVTGSTGYQPATPIPAGTPGPCSTSSTTDPPHHPEGQP